LIKATVAVTSDAAITHGRKGSCPLSKSTG
jgi:hypothetical protein